MITEEQIMGAQRQSSLVREIEYYVNAGMTPVQALRAGTIEMATLLGPVDRPSFGNGLW